MTEKQMENNIIQKYFKLTPTQSEQFRLLGRLYPDWNEKINVISRKDIDNLYVNHILHSLAIARFITPAEGTTILDMGTGGGFPGIPLAIMWPQCRFHLIDRIGKKIKVAADIATQIGLKNVTFQHGDIGECRERFDFVVSRAVMRLDELIPLIRKNISAKSNNGIPNGLICLKGGDLQSEMHDVKFPTLVESLDTYFDEPFFDTKKIVYVQIK
ncbi:MAG: 16S rRNA (guanine(527)-N(7))-methyltransferase RsmG [Muribaculum sp.]|nr:16S rRNA (guanine(527)-N(7))-methyltransferase RsmG [Muribaculum sp.]